MSLKVVPGDGFEPPTRGFSIQHHIQQNQGVSVSKPAPTKHEQTAKVSNGDLTPANENPDALAGAVGAETIVEIGCTDNTSNLPAYATAFIDAVTNLPAEDRLPMLELAADHYRAGQPIPPLMGYMDEAAFWADWACRDELKAYALACYNRLCPSDQAAFLGYVHGRAAA